MKEAVVACGTILKFAWRTDEDYEKPQSVQPFSGLDRNQRSLIEQEAGMINIRPQRRNRTQVNRYSRFPCQRLRISAVLFHYQKEHWYSIHCQIVTPVTRVELSPGLSWYVIQMTSLPSKNSGANLISKWWLLCVSGSTFFQHTYNQPHTVYNESHLCRNNAYRYRMWYVM